MSAWRLITALAPMLAAFAAQPAAAQVSLSATAETDYRVRGVSLSNGGPSLRLSAAYDHESGAYGGTTLVFGQPRGGEAGAVGHILYLGYARRLDSGVTVDMGAARLDVRTAVRGAAPAGYVPPASFGPYPYADPALMPRDPAGGRGRARYSEAYAGILKGGLSGHVYVSPDYFGRSGSAYLDLNASVRPHSRVRLFWHAGLLTPLSSRGGRSRYDVRSGAALEFRRAELQLAWSAVGRGAGADYPDQRRQTLVLSASAFF